MVKPGRYDYLDKIKLEKPEWVLDFSFHPMANYFQKGDKFLSENPQFLGNLINKVSSFYSVDNKSEYSHSGIITNTDGTILEASWTVQHNNLLETYEGKKVLVARHNEMTINKFNSGMKKIEEHIGQIYPFPRLLLHLIGLAKHVHWNRVVCSELCAKFLFGADLFSYKYFGVTPDLLNDIFKKELNDERTGPKYKIVYENILPVNIYKRCMTCNVNILVPHNHSNCPACNYSNSLNQESVFLPELVKYNSSKKIKG